MNKKLIFIILICSYKSVFSSSEERCKSLNKITYLPSPLGRNVITISDDDYYYKSYEAQMNSVNAHRSITIRCGLRFFYRINHLINNVFYNYLK